MKDHRTHPCAGSRIFAPTLAQASHGHCDGRYFIGRCECRLWRTCACTRWQQACTSGCRRCVSWSCAMPSVPSANKMPRRCGLLDANQGIPTCRVISVEEEYCDAVMLTVLSHLLAGVQRAHQVTDAATSRQPGSRGHRLPRTGVLASRVVLKAGAALLMPFTTPPCTLGSAPLHVPCCSDGAAAGMSHHAARREVPPAHIVSCHNCRELMTGSTRRHADPSAY